MEELIAKRYVKAIKDSIGEADLQSVQNVFCGIAAEFANAKFNQIMNSPDTSSEQKEALLIESVKSAQSEKINNVIRLLIENNRINIIPAIAEELGKEIARSTKSYKGTVYSNSEIDSSVIEGLGVNLGKKVDASISLDFVKNDFDGIKVEVEDLGIEVNFSKSRLNMQIIDHILKAI